MDRPTLSRAFYAREPDRVAHDLIGKILIRELDDEVLSGRIVETEAYRGAGDAASHAYGGETSRNSPMFGPPGYTYVYFIYGVHWMLNLSAHPEGTPGAVLIRALEPLKGVEVMHRRRGTKKPLRQLTNGPAKLAEALAIDGALNNIDLCAGKLLTITEGDLAPDAVIASGPRVRVPGDEAAKAKPWRFWLADSPFISV